MGDGPAGPPSRACQLTSRTAHAPSMCIVTRLLRPGSSSTRWKPTNDFGAIGTGGLLDRAQVDLRDFGAFPRAGVAQREGDVNAVSAALHGELRVLEPRVRQAVAEGK